MDVTKFERLCNERKMKAIKKVIVGPYIVLIADGFLAWHPTYEKPHYQTMWAVGKSEDNIVIARPLYFDPGAADLDKRVAAAEFDGVSFAKDLHERLHGNGTEA